MNATFPWIAPFSILELGPQWNPTDPFSCFDF
jgi:hypothetical protein